MASARQDPFHSSWFVFEEPPAAGHRERVHFQTENLPAKAIAPSNRNPTVNSAPAASATSKRRRMRRFTIDFLLRLTASILVISVAVISASRSQYAEGPALWLREHFSRLSPGTSPSVDAAAIRPIVHDYFQEYVQRFFDAYIAERLLPLVQSSVEQYAQQDIQPYLEQCVRRQIMEHGEPFIAQHARTFLRQQISGRRDFAYQADGARVVPKLTTVDAVKARNSLHNHPEVVLRPNLEGGRCWTILEARGQIGISVSRLIYPSHITVDHIPAEVADDIRQAPRRVRLWGCVDGSQNGDRYREYVSLHPGSYQPPSTGPPITNGYKFVHLGDLEYDVNATSHVQTFPVYEYSPPLAMDFGVFVIEILDNWGGASTCLYRLHIHGEPSFRDEV